jgi:hypothetical protein
MITAVEKQVQDTGKTLFGEDTAVDASHTTLRRHAFDNRLRAVIRSHAKRWREADFASVYILDVIRDYQHVFNRQTYNR